MCAEITKRHISVVLKGVLVSMKWGLMLVVLVVITVATIGFPKVIVERIEDHFTNEGFVIELGRVRFNIFKGVHVNHFKLLRREELGPPILDAQRMFIHANFLNALIRKPVVGKVSMGGGSFSSLMLESPDSTTSQPHVRNFEIEVELDDFVIEGVGLDDFSARLVSESGAWSCRSASMIVRRGDRKGRITGNAEYADKEEFEALLNFECDPGILLPLMNASQMDVSSEIVRRFTFSSIAPTWTLGIKRNREVDPETVTTIDFRMEDFSFRGVPLELANGAIQISSSSSRTLAVLEDILLFRGDESLQGGVRYAATADRTNVTYEATSTLHPYALTAIVGVWTNLENEIYRFESPFKIDVRGNSDIGPRFGSHAQFDMSFGRLSVSRIDIDDCAFTCYVEGNKNRLENLTGGWCGGSLSGQLAMQFPNDDQTNKVFNLAATVADANLDNVVASIFDSLPRDSGGKLSGDIVIERLTDTVNKASMRGHGALRITDGQLLRLQVFGGLSDYVARMIPGVDVLLSHTDFMSEFELEDDVIHSDKVLLEGDLLSLLGKGSYWLDGTLDYNVQLEFLRSHTLVHDIISVPMFLFTKLFEFKLKGTREEPTWYPINFSASLFDRLRGGGDKKESSEAIPK